MSKTVTPRTRKILWGKSGNRCVFCKNKLVHSIVELHDDFIVGEECHIVSAQEYGPRGKAAKLEDYNAYSNLILLCANHHKLIDEFPETFTVELLQIAKNNHEAWVDSAVQNDLEEYARSANNIELLDEVKDHNDISFTVSHAHLFFFDMTTVSEKDQAVEISALFDSLRDLVDIYDDMEFVDRIRYVNECLEIIQRVNEQGIKLFAKGLSREYEFKNVPKSQYKIAMFVAYRTAANPLSIQNGKLAIKLPANFAPGF